MTPDASLHDPRPEYLRSLLQQAGLSQRAAARRIGISERVMRYYLAAESADYRPAPYPVQFAIEALRQSYALVQPPTIDERMAPDDYAPMPDAPVPMPEEVRADMRQERDD